MEPRIIKPDWFLAATYVGLIAVVLLSVWMTLVGLATSSGIYENLDPAERHAGTPLAIISLACGIAAVAALLGFVVASSRWATLGGVGVIVAGAAALVGPTLWVATNQQSIASILVSIVGFLAIIAAQRYTIRPNKAAQG